VKRGRSPVSAPALYGYGYRVIDRVRDRVRDRDMDRVRDRVRIGGLAIAAHSYSGPNRFQWGRKLEFARETLYLGKRTLIPLSNFS